MLQQACGRIDFLKNNSKASLGRTGEEAACRYLEGLGFRITERNWRTRDGEIDIIATKRNLMVFIEVKARRGTDFGGGEEAVTPSKVRRIRALATRYLSEVNKPGEVRFDVISVVLDGEGNPADLRHIPGAF